LETWDVFHSDRLEVERSLTTAQVRELLARGDIHDDDLVRPAGTSVPWEQLGEYPTLLEPPSAAASAPPPDEPPPPPPPVSVPSTAAREEPEFEPPSSGEFAPDADEEPEAIEDVEAVEEAGAPEPDAGHWSEVAEDLRNQPFRFDDDDEDDLGGEVPSVPAAGGHAGSEASGEFELNLDRGGRVPLPTAEEGDFLDEGDFGPGLEDEYEYDPQDEDEEAAEFTLARGATETVEELDLAAMVDVAFQLVLFFLVTATTVLYKTLEVPKPNPDSAPAAATQGQNRTIDDLQRDFILVEIDPEGAIKVDHEPISAEALIPRLRKAREETARSAMLLTADFATPHRNAVLAYDAANEIGLRIAIAKPANAVAPPPPPLRAAKKAAQG
jgi:biopolymer transport protein ExbD